MAGSLIGGIRETQEMLDFCADHGIVSDIELIPIQKINDAYDRMLKSDVKYRFVIDLASLKQEPPRLDQENDRADKTEAWTTGMSPSVPAIRLLISSFERSKQTV
jgi:hypothetical protein